MPKAAPLPFQTSVNVAPPSFDSYTPTGLAPGSKRVWAPLPIVCSDVYEWAAGGRFVLHTAHGLIGGVPVGAVEMIGYDEGSQAYRSQLFDSLGNVSTHELVLGADGPPRTYRGRRALRAVDAGYPA